MCHLTSLIWYVCILYSIIQVFAIEFITFAIDFFPFAVDFVTFAVEFIPFGLISLFASDHIHRQWQSTVVNVAEEAIAEELLPYKELFTTVVLQ